MKAMWGKTVTMKIVTTSARTARRFLLTGIVGFVAMVLYPEYNQLFAQTTPATEEATKILGRCLQCHGEGIQMGDLDLHTRAAMMKGGTSGPAVVLGKADESILIQRVSGQKAPLMPMKPVAPLNAKEIEILKSWINQGAKWDSADAPATTSADSAKPAASPYGSYKERTFTEADRNWWAFKPPVR